MYTNIGIDTGTNSVKRTFDKYPDSDRPDKNIIDLLELSLKGNYFEFNGEMYQQVWVVMLRVNALDQIWHPSISLNGKRLFKINLSNLLFYISDI